MFIEKPALSTKLSLWINVTTTSISGHSSLFLLGKKSFLKIIIVQNMWFFIAYTCTNIIYMYVKLVGRSSWVQGGEYERASVEIVVSYL